MSKRNLVLIIVGILSIFLLAACDFSSSSCQSQTIGLSGTISCTQEWKQLESRTRASYDVEAITPVVTVAAEITLTVQEGNVRLGYENGDWEQAYLQAAAGAPATYAGQVRLYGADSVQFSLEPLGGMATGVQLQVRFTD